MRDVKNSYINRLINIKGTIRQTIDGRYILISKGDNSFEKYLSFSELYSLISSPLDLAVGRAVFLVLL